MWMYHEDDYFEKTPIEKQRVCCNCRQRTTPDKCSVDGHYIGYMACMMAWCRHWASDEAKWKEKGDESVDGFR